MALIPPGPAIWSDEFSGVTIDSTNWSPSSGRWSASIQQQQYTSLAKNVRQNGNGQLFITAYREVPPDGAVAPNNYTSAQLTTQGLREFTPPVRIIASIKVPAGTGAWPAFWMLGDNPEAPWPANGEIDLMEAMQQYSPTFAPTTLHGPMQANPRQDCAAGFTYHAPASLAGAYHQYGMDWYPDRVEFHLDGKVIHIVTQSAYTTAGGDWTPFSGAWSFYLLINMAVTQAVDTSPFPQTMIVDWVRAWWL